MATAPLVAQRPHALVPPGPVLVPLHLRREPTSLGRAPPANGAARPALGVLVASAAAARARRHWALRRRAASCDAAGPSDLLRSWRRARRGQVVKAVRQGWGRTDCQPRGPNDVCALQNVGPLVGYPPSLWVYFVGHEGAPCAAQDTLHLFEKACDAMESYSLVFCRAGCLDSATLALSSSNLDEEQDVDASHVLTRYDVVVALDESTKERLTGLATSPEERARVCCLVDFADFCEETAQRAQLRQLLGPGAEGPAPSLAQRPELLPGREARALCAFGLERFIISQFPVDLKDRLHPYLVPKGL